MSRKRCRRKVYEMVNPITHAIERASITSQQDLDRLRTAELGSIEAFAKGHAEDQDWKRMADVSNITQTMVGMGIGPEAQEAIDAVNAALGEALRRKHEHGKLGVTGLELRALRDLFEYHDLQRTSVSRGTYAEAIRLTAERIRSTPAAQRVEI